MRLKFSLALIILGMNCSASTDCEVSVSRSARQALIALKAGVKSGDLSLASLREFAASKAWTNPYRSSQKPLETLWFNQVFVSASRGLNEKERAWLRSEAANLAARKAVEEKQVEEAQSISAKIISPQYLYQLTSAEFPGGQSVCYVAPVEIDGRMAFAGQHLKLTGIEKNQTFLIQPFHRDPKRRLQVVSQAGRFARAPKFFVKDGVPYATDLQSELFVNLREGKEVPNLLGREFSEDEDSHTLFTQVGGKYRRYTISDRDGEGEAVYEFNDFDPQSPPKKLARADHGLREHKIGSNHYLTAIRFDGEAPGLHIKNTIVLIDLKLSQVIHEVQTVTEAGAINELAHAVLYMEKGDLHLNYRLGNNVHQYTTHDLNLRTGAEVTYPSQFELIRTRRTMIHVDGRPYFFYRTSLGFAFEDPRRQTVEVNSSVPDVNGDTGHPKLFSWRGKRYWLMGGGQELWIVDVDTRSIAGRYIVGRHFSEVFPFSHNGDIYAVVSFPSEMPHLYQITSEHAPK